MTKYISLIVAVGPKNVIGVGDKLIWHSKKDLQYFKCTTENHPCIFGSKTFYGLPFYPLKNRLNIVLDNTQKEEITADNRGWVTCNSFECALLFCENYDEIYICGGKSIYEYALKYGFVNKVLLTRIHADWIDEMLELNNQPFVYFDVDEYLKEWNKQILIQDTEADCLGQTMCLSFEVYQKPIL